MIKYIYCVVFMFLCSSCSQNKASGVYVELDEITASEITLIPNKETKKVTTTLTFGNLNNIEYLTIKNSARRSYSRKIDKSELTSSYLLSYAIDTDDPENFKLLLRAFYKNGHGSKEIKLTVDNRWGFFVRNVSRIARVTGTTMSSETFPSPNNTATKWNVGGTDLGIVWEMASGKYGIFFGDTFGKDFAPNHVHPGPNGGSWRCNVLAYSEDDNLEDGLLISSMATDNDGNAREIVYGAKNSSGHGDWTSIPTAAIRSNGIDYVHYFNMKDWAGWITNYSGMYRSTDNGQTWSKCDNVSFGSNSNFGQGGYFKQDGYVYMIGTETGRASNPRLARFLESDIENQSEYEYWNKNESQWMKGNESTATNLFEDEVGELSFIYNEKHQKWIIAYFNGPRYNITMRTAKSIVGPWSSPYELVAGTEYAQLYGSYFHPLSVKGDNLYFLMSMWLPYNVFLMKVELADMGDF